MILWKMSHVEQDDIMTQQMFFSILHREEARGTWDIQESYDREKNLYA